jgi:transposase
MMGKRSGGQKQLFYSFNLDDHVPANHLLRGIDQFLDLSELHQDLAPFYSHTGRPSVDPQLLIRMLVVGYCFGIRSERRLCKEAHLNLAYRGFCRLGLDAVPDHSTFSKNRHGRFRDSDTLRFVFEQVLERCVREGLVGGEWRGIRRRRQPGEGGCQCAAGAWRVATRAGRARLRSAVRCANISRRWTRPRSKDHSQRRSR